MYAIKPVAAALLLFVAARGVTQEHQDGNGEKLGEVHFATSCNEAAQSEFNRAAALLHSFEFSRAIEGFNAVLREDSTCAIAYWGIALSDWSNPFATGSQGSWPAAARARESSSAATSWAQRRIENALISRPSASCTATLKARRSKHACSPIATPWGTSRQNIRKTTRRRSSTHWRSQSRKIPETRPIQTGSRREPFSRTCSRRSRRIPVWHTTLSMRTTCRRSRSGHSSRRDVTRKLPPMRLMRCTCHRIHLPDWDTGKSPLTATLRPQRPRGARVRRRKSCMPATMRLTPTCKPGRTRRQRGL